QWCAEQRDHFGGLHLIRSAAVLLDLAHDVPHPLVEQRVQARGVETRSERVEVGNAGTEYRDWLALDEGHGAWGAGRPRRERPVAPTGRRAERLQPRPVGGDRVEPCLLLWR